MRVDCNACAYVDGGCGVIDQIMLDIGALRFAWYSTRATGDVVYDVGFAGTWQMSDGTRINRVRVSPVGRRYAVVFGASSGPFGYTPIKSSTMLRDAVSDYLAKELSWCDQ